MRFLLAVIVIATLGWSGYWFVGQRGLEQGFAHWFEGRRAKGWVAETSDLDVQGFPNRFDTGFTDLMLADPATGLAWEAPYFQLSALSYQPNHVIAVWPETQLIATPQEKFRVDARDMRASLRIAPDTRLAPRNLTLTADFLQVTPEVRPDETTALTSLTLAVEQLQERDYRLGLAAEGLTLAPPWRDLLDPDGELPAQISNLTADLTVSFDKIWDRSAVEDARPQPTYIKVALIDGRWGQLHLQAAGEVAVTPDGLPEGEITLKARNWRDMIALAQASGALPEGMAQTVENGLELLARMNGNRETLDVPLSFRGGRILLGPIPIGPAPVLRLR
ncbi:hypothetical protein RA2_00722 [Roseovarius sp. A-2]|uniref:DUF2125 domain-containing protein n=1 Tax=Roseovarius sp. A-2 TaxID=1570360 RepID=UPI0009B5659E|nr:DUF2125 domain-containing protein [Roseovarius sp. A-2]GAW33679.1 hypothetical protein RA2_00722 [Roseovarius sp. A-2]